jgi:hypothetical protein
MTIVLVSFIVTENELAIKIISALFCKNNKQQKRKRY